MNWGKLRTYALGIILVEAVGLLSGLLSRGGAEAFRASVLQPPLSPPGWVFPVVWTILYALMGVSAVRVWQSPSSGARSRGLNLFAAQLILNFFWPLIFFNARAYGLAFVWVVVLWVLVLLMILEFRKVDRVAALLQIPYLIWLTFAAYLAFGVWRLNG